MWLCNFWNNKCMYFICVCQSFCLKLTFNIIVICCTGSFPFSPVQHLFTRTPTQSLCAIFGCVPCPHAKRSRHQGKSWQTGSLIVDLAHLRVYTANCSSNAWQNMPRGYPKAPVENSTTVKQLRQQRISLLHNFLSPSDTQLKTLYGKPKILQLHNPTPKRCHGQWSGQLLGQLHGPSITQPIS